MRALIVCLLVLALGVQTLAFDAQRYASFGFHARNIPMEVEATKRKILDPNFFASPVKKGLALEPLLADMLQRPIPRAYISSTVVTASGNVEGVANATRQLIEEKCTQYVAEIVSQFRIKPATSIDIDGPNISIKIVLDTHWFNGGGISLETVVELNRVLVDPGTGLRTIATVWYDSMTAYLGMDESKLVEMSWTYAGIILNQLLKDQYQKFLAREAVSQLHKEGRLPQEMKAALRDYKDW